MNDARLMAETLKALGFTLVGGGAQLDLDKAGIDRAVQKFGTQLQGADVALFYYAGHGVQVRGVELSRSGRRQSNARGRCRFPDGGRQSRAAPDGRVAGTRLNMVILDACRNNPFGGAGLRVFRRRPRADAGAGGHADLVSRRSPATSRRTAATATAPTPRRWPRRSQAGLDIFQTFNQVGLAVKRETGGAQQPWVSSRRSQGAFYLCWS